MNILYYQMGQRIGLLRRKHHITQEKMAEHLDVSVKHVSEVERGLSSYSLDKLVKAADLLDCTMDYLFYGSDTRNALSFFPATVINILSSDNEREIQLFKEYMTLYGRLRKKMPPDE